MKVERWAIRLAFLAHNLTEDWKKKKKRIRFHAHFRKVWRILAASFIAPRGLFLEFANQQALELFLLRLQILLRIIVSVLSLLSCSFPRSSITKAPFLFSKFLSFIFFFIKD